MNKEPKVALVFDWLTTAGGAEQVNRELLEIFPNAKIFTSLYNPQKVKGFENAEIETSFIQKIPFAKKKHQIFLPLMPYAYESFDLSEYDIVISSSHSCAKGVITKPETTHICYCHTPMRYAWDNWHEYINQYKINWFVKKLSKKMMHKIRIWDKLSADRVDHFIANSSTTKKRITKYYRKDSKVIFPMLDTSKYKIAKKTKGYFLAVGRLIPYKRFDLIIEAFNELGIELKIAGTGIMNDELRAIANENIEFLGYVSDEDLLKAYSECEALIFPQLEDFGITPLEAMASGRPVIAYGKGGALDTIIDGTTGMYFKKQTKESLINKIKEFQKIKNKFNTIEIQKHAQKFDKKVFQKQILEFVKEKHKASK